MANPILRRVCTGGVVAVTAVAATTGPGSAAAPARPDLRSPAAGHSYRHGVVPVLGEQHRDGRRSRTTTDNLKYGGGIDGIGVTTGPEKVYLVFYGSQWGTAHTDTDGIVTLSGDPQSLAPYLQRMFKGLGTNGELWSGVMTQYCQGVAAGAKGCPGDAEHVAYPAGGALAGVWVDRSTASPQQADGHTLAAEAVSAAAHFGNTAAGSNRNAQYVIVSPTGTRPDGFNTPSGGFCAWHSYSADPGLPGGAASPLYGDIAFTNSPYLTDAGASCGQNFVNGNGTLDGVSIVGGHEYAETITDQNPAGGWTDSSGEENADKCEWLSPGQPGGPGNLSLATGTFAMQGTWANDAAGCRFTHPIVDGGGVDSVTVTNPGGQRTAAGSPVHLQITATDSEPAQPLTFSAAGLPVGLSMNPATGLISGTPRTAGTRTVVVTAADPTNSVGHTAFTWTITPTGIVNGGFETGTLTGWTRTGAATGIVKYGAHSGAYSARAGLTTPTSGSSSISQTFTIPYGRTNLSFWYEVSCPDTVHYDWATATLRDNTTRTTRTVLARTCVRNSGWRRITSPVVPGRSYTLTLTSHDDHGRGDATYARYDDVRL